jgi:hypothetical protein
VKDVQRSGNSPAVITFNSLALRPDFMPARSLERRFTRPANRVI